MRLISLIFILISFGLGVIDSMTAEMIHSHEIVQYISYSHRAQRSQLLVLRRPQASGPEFHVALPANPQLSHWIRPFRLTLQGEHVVSQALVEKRMLFSAQGNLPDHT
jgi:hypothetical protein